MTRAFAPGLGRSSSYPVNRNSARPALLSGIIATAATLLVSGSALAGEAELVVPDLSSQSFLGMPGSTLLMIGLAICALGLIFGMVIFTKVKNLPVHQSMREISELIYETCKTYLVTQGKFLVLL